MGTVEDLVRNIPRWCLDRRFGTAAVAATLVLVTLLLKATVGESQIVDTALSYLLVTLVAAAAWGFTVGIGTAIAADLTVNFFFVPPLHTFSVRDASHVVTLSLFLAVAMTGASMLALLRSAAATARARHAEADLLLGLVRDMGKAASASDALARLCRRLEAELGSVRVDVLDYTDGWCVLALDERSPVAPSRDESLLASKAVNEHRVMRLGSTSPRTPLIRGQRGVEEARQLSLIPLGDLAPPAVLRVSGQRTGDVPFDVERVYEGFASEATTGLARLRLATAAREAEDLRRADRFKTLLLSMVSHDLRSPLTAIRAAVDNLRDDSVAWSEEDTARFLETIDDQTTLLTDTVASLLEMGRLEAGAVRTKMEPVDIDALLHEAADSRRPGLAGHAITIDVPRGLTAFGDHALLVRAVCNILENAVKYSEPGTEVRLTAVSDSEGVSIAVVDQGPGIAREDLGRVFDKFYRGSRVSNVPGAGLGLAIARGIVELCGGRIDVESSPRGSQFTLHLKGVA